jgi:hypothetical protein
MTLTRVFFATKDINISQTTLSRLQIDTRAFFTSRHFFKWALHMPPVLPDGIFSDQKIANLVLFGRPWDDKFGVCISWNLYCRLGILYGHFVFLRRC